MVESVQSIENFAEIVKSGDPKQVLALRNDLIKLQQNLEKKKSTFDIEKFLSLIDEAIKEIPADSKEESDITRKTTLETIKDNLNAQYSKLLPDADNYNSTLKNLISSARILNARTKLAAKSQEELSIANKVLGTLNTKLSLQQSVIESLEKNIEQLKSEIEVTNTQIRTIMDLIDTNNSIILKLRTEVKNLEADCLVKKKNIDQLRASSDPEDKKQTQLSILEQHLKQLETNIESKKTEIASYQTIVTRHQQELDLHNQIFTDKQNELTSSQETLKSLNSERDELTKNYLAKADDISGIEKTSTHNKKRLEYTQGTLAPKHEAVIAAEKSYTEILRSFLDSCQSVVEKCAPKQETAAQAWGTYLSNFVPSIPTLSLWRAQSTPKDDDVVSLGSSDSDVDDPKTFAEVAARAVRPAGPGRAAAAGAGS